MGLSSFPVLGFNPCPGDPDAVTTLAGKWQDAAFLLTEIALRLDHTDDAQGRWKGQAAEAFGTKLSGHRVTIGKLRASYEHNADLLKQWVGPLRDFQTEAATLETRAAVLDEQRRRATTGPVATPQPAPQASPTPGPATSTLSLQQVQTQLSGVHTQAGQLHERYLDAARALARQVSGLLTLPSGTTGWYGQNIDAAQERALLNQESHRKGGVVPLDPALRAAWWKSLTPAEQAAIVRDHATDLGASNGLPADARSAANLVLLQRYRDQASAKLIQLERTAPGSDAAKAAATRYETLKDLYRSLTDPRNPNYRQPSYLLGIDEVGPGHAIVCYGNPDTALNTAVYVPGTGSKLDGIRGDAGRARDMFDAAQKAAPGTIASMVWLGYDAPQNPAKDSPFQSWADNGAQSLADYVNSLALTHQGPSHTTVIGHSYGSTLVGEAAARAHMHADDIIAVGSPGLTVDHASDLHMDPNHVWAARMETDPIPMLSLPLTADPTKWYNDYSGRFGTDPTSRDFGGKTFAAGFGDIGNPIPSHSDYWHSDQPSLANMTRIVTGDTQHVTAPSNVEHDGSFPTGPVGMAFQTAGGLTQNAGHAIPDGYGAPVEHVGNVLSQVGHGQNAAVGGAADLLTGNLNGAKHQAEDVAHDAEGIVTDGAEALITPFTGW